MLGNKIKWEKICLLGEGSYGRVFNGMDETGKIIAVKILSTDETLGK